MLIAAKSTALNQNDALTPHTAMTRPPIAGPIAKHSEKDTLSSVLPASRSPVGFSVAATAARVSARPTKARVPSAAARTSTSTKKGDEVIIASAAKMAASAT